MKNIYLSLFTLLLLFSCSDPIEIISGDAMENEFVSSCVAETPGGSSYVAVCQCAWDETLTQLTPEEEEAMRRDFNEMGDQIHAMNFSLKSIEAASICVEEQLQ